MRRDQVVVDVARMAGGVAQPRDAGNFGDAMQAAAPSVQARPGTFAMIGVDVLADQRHLAHAGSGEVRTSARIFSTGRETSAPRV